MTLFQILALLEDTIGKELIVINLILKYILAEKLEEVVSEITTVMESLELTKREKVLRINFVEKVPDWE